MHLESAPYYEWTPEQADALDALRAFLAGPPGVFVLAGYAGTGKTTLVVEALRQRAGRIVFTAPTHKAVGVLADKGLIPSADYATIHRLLACKRQRSGGETAFLPDMKKAAWPGYDVIVADEVSMVGETIWAWMSDAQATWPRHVICMGDPAQLPPVNDGEGISPALGNPNAQLTEVKRSAGLVLAAASRIREHLAAVVPVEVTLGTDHLGTVEHLGREAFMESARRDFEQGVDAKILAWTNDAVDFLNAEMRARIFGADVSQTPQEGELLTVVTTWSSNDETVTLHAESMVMVDYAEATTVHADPHDRESPEIPCWVIDTEQAELYMVRPEGKAALSAALSNARHRGRSTGDWGPYYRIQDRFTALRPGYATTVHKSQGSTYHTAYVVDRNLRQCHDPRVRNMLRYVAFSRASHRLVIG